MELMHIAGSWPLCTNTFLLFFEDGTAAAVDPAAPPEQYLKALESKGSQLTHILLTHGHYDHVGAAAALKHKTGAKIMMDPVDAQETEMFPLRADLVDENWPGSGSLTLGKEEFRIWRTPGHTKGSVCIWCGGKMFSGDTLFALSCGRVDLPGGSAAEMQRSLSLLANLPLPDETEVYPGHESFTTLGRERRLNPYLLGEWY